MLAFFMKIIFRMVTGKHFLAGDRFLIVCRHFEFEIYTCSYFIFFKYFFLFFIICFQSLKKGQPLPQRYDKISIKFNILFI